ncbi:transcription factor IIA subunit alpha [Modicella reniformis]|uniref:Transcription initiation factor IIA large subunit n=1 Tax=Modicella reniformis TaxID=1440133 RepID=A0A9P6MIA8_9FUNG|nr:transcription factor IIA subunit alpha [Modicella reniformis]
MSNNNVNAVYRFVIDDVITNVRRDFEDMGVDETIMHELQRSWEVKIAQSKAYNYRVEQTPAASLANVASTTLQGDSNNTGRPQPHVPPRSNPGGNSNISLPGGGRNGTTDSSNIPQTDGAADMTTELEFMNTTELDAYVEKRFQEAREAEASTEESAGEVTFTLTLSDRAARKAKRDGLVIGQVDGEEEDDDDTGLGSDLDDSDGDMDDESENIVLCQYDKVSRTKSKWKCVLKDGIMLINGRDYLFHKANGDFEW